MADFTLDTSGVVIVPLSLMTSGDPGLNGSHHHTFAGLSPFEQGYVEGLLSPSEALHYSLTDRFAGFSDLHPETLAAIRKDCDQRRRPDVPDRAEYGRRYWAQRQTGEFADYAPPLTPFLDDEGKVRLLREGAQNG